MKVLVTGGAGFLGRAIAVRLRQRGDTVLSLSRAPHPDLVDLGIETIRGDIADRETVMSAASGCEAVFHVAARIGSWGPYQEFYRTNVVGTENVIAACRHHGTRKLIYTSTPSVVHTGGDAEGIDETQPYASHFSAHYPRTKAIAERMVLQANGPTLSTVALRPHLIWGPGDNQLLPRAVAQARAGKLRLVGGPERRVDSVYIDNAADVHIEACDRLAPGAACAGRAYFISNGEPMPLNDLVNRVLQAAGVAPVTKTISPGLLRVAGILSEAVYALLHVKREPRVTRFVAEQLTTSHWFDISAARRDLGYQPRVSIEEGLSRLRASLSSERQP